jgi:hypothetical protein
VCSRRISRRFARLAARALPVRAVCFAELVASRLFVDEPAVA